LVATLLILVLLGVLLSGFIISVNSDQGLINVDREQTRTFYSALAGLEQIKAKRELLGLCADAEALYKGGDLVKAREKYTEISLKAAGACDASLRIVDINRLTALYRYMAGMPTDAAPPAAPN